MSYATTRLEITPKNAVTDPAVIDALGDAIAKVERHVSGMPSKGASEMTLRAWTRDADSFTAALTGANYAAEQSASEFRARPMLEYIFNTTQGYRYSIEYRNPVVTVEENTVDALPGKTKLQFTLTYGYTVTNLLPDKNAPIVDIADLVPVWRAGAAVCAAAQQEIRRATDVEGRPVVVGCAQTPASGHSIGRVGGAGGQFAPSESAAGEGKVGVILEVADSDAPAIKSAFGTPDGWALDGASGHLWSGPRAGVGDTNRVGYCKALSPTASGTSDYLFALTIDLGCVTATEFTY